MTICEFQAKRITRISGSLAHFIATTDPDKLDWCPSCAPTTQQPNDPTTRSIFGQVSECVVVNRVVAGILRGENFEFSPRNMPQIEFWDSADAQNQIVESGKALA